MGWEKGQAIISLRILMNQPTQKSNCSLIKNTQQLSRLDAEITCITELRYINAKMPSWICRQVRLMFSERWMEDGHSVMGAGSTMPVTWCCSTEDIVKGNWEN